MTESVSECFGFHLNITNLNSKPDVALFLDQSDIDFGSFPGYLSSQNKTSSLLEKSILGDRTQYDPFYYLGYLFYRTPDLGF